MKKTYIKPVFIAEAYNFNESFAKDCKLGVDPNNPLTYNLGDNICVDENGTTDEGHTVDPKGEIFKANKNLTSITIFNDGAAYGPGKCDYDWAGPGKSVFGPDPNNPSEIKNYGIFQKALSGAGADNGQHLPAYQDQEMFS